MTLDNPLGYGRILRGTNRQILGIKEEKDASPDQRRIKEVNSGIMALNSNLLKTLIPNLVSERDCSCQSSLRDTIITSKEWIPEELKRKLSPLINKYI